MTVTERTGLVCWVVAEYQALTRECWVQTWHTRAYWLRGSCDWSEQSSTGIDHAEEMELLLENCYRLAEDLSHAARELRALIDDSQSVIFINLDSHRNVMMRLNLQLTMGTFSLSLFGLIGVAFGMNLESSLEEDHRVFWLITGIMFMGSGLIWRRLLSFLGRQLEAPLPPMVAPLPRKTLQADRRLDVKQSLRPDGLGSSRSVLTPR